MAEIVGTAGADLLDGTLEADSIAGGEGNDSIRGDGFAPGTSGGGGGIDTLLGGADTIDGGAGDDAVAGGPGADLLTGGPAADRFVYGSHIPIDPFYITPDIFVLDTGVGEGARDVIGDFEQGVDVIDLSPLLTLGYRSLDINEAYEFIGGAPFGGQRAEVRVVVDEEGGRTVVQIDGTEFSAGEVLGVDGVADAEIEITGALALVGSDFVL